MSHPAPIAADPESLERLRNLVAHTLSLASREGATGAEAAASCNAGLSVNVRMGEVETIEHTRDKGLGVTVYVGHRKGSASTSDFSGDAVHETVRAACNIARYASEDPCAGLADAARMAVNPPDLDLYHPWSLPPEEAIEVATRCEDSARSADARITNSEGASVSRGDAIFCYGNSHGFLDGYPSSRHSLSCAVIAGTGDGMQRDYWYGVARCADELENPEEVGRRAAERTVSRLDARKLSTRETPVVYSADVARGLFQHFLSAIRGASQYRKASFLLDAVGQQVFPDFIRLHEEPHLRGALGSAAFDGEGVATVDSNAGALDELLAEMGEGLLITELMGFGINGVTGDYSRGASGFWVENGAIAYPVHEITVAGNLKRMFMGIRAVGNDVDLRGNIRCGSVLIDRMTVAGN